MSYQSDDDRDVASAWLTKPELRSHLNDQLAQALEAVVVNQENEALGGPPNHTPFSYCPVCGEELTESGTDGWVKSYLCKRKHKINERGSRLWTAEEELCSAMSPDFSYQVLESFATRENLKRVVPRQVSELLLHILGARRRHSR